MSRPSASSALRFLTHDVIKKTSLCWALYRMYARPIEIVIRPGISISIFMSATLTYSRSYLMLDPRQQLENEVPSVAASREQAMADFKAQWTGLSQ